MKAEDLKRLKQELVERAFGRDAVHEPNRGETRVELPKSLFQDGKTLTVAVRPISSLGTKGRAVGITYYRD